MDSIKTVIIWIGAEVAIEVIKSRVVGAYMLGVEIESLAGVDWVPALCLGAWWFSRVEAKNRDMGGWGGCQCMELWLPVVSWVSCVRYK